MNISNKKLPLKFINSISIFAIFIVCLIPLVIGCILIGCLPQWHDTSYITTFAVFVALVIAFAGALLITLWKGKLTVIKIYNDRIEWRARFRKQSILLNDAKVQVGEQSAYIYEYGICIIDVYSNNNPEKKVRFTLRHLKHLSLMLSVMQSCELFDFVANKVHSIEDKRRTEFTSHDYNNSLSTSHKSIKIINNKSAFVILSLSVVIGISSLLLLCVPQLFEYWKWITVAVAVWLVCVSVLWIMMFWSGGVSVIVITKDGISSSVRLSRKVISYSNMEIERSYWCGYDSAVKWKLKYVIVDRNDSSHHATIRFKTPRQICKLLNVVPESKLRDLLLGEIS